jgi:hypothetical protein
MELWNLNKEARSKERTLMGMCLGNAGVLCENQTDVQPMWSSIIRPKRQKELWQRGLRKSDPRKKKYGLRKSDLSKK